MPHPEPWRLLWAKTDLEDPEHGLVRPLWAHLLDVGGAALILWQRSLSPRLRRTIARDLGLEEEIAGKWLALFIALHDIGKAIPFFQGLHAPSRARLEAEGFAFERFEQTPLHHGHASIAILYRYFKKMWPDDPAPEMLYALTGYHHGRLAPRRQWRDAARMRRGPLGDERWQQAQEALLEAVKQAWVGGDPWPEGLLKTEWKAWGLPFAGWVTLADWIGSMAECFNRRCPKADDDLQTYAQAIEPEIACALEASGLLYGACLQPFTSFKEAFGFAPRPLQAIMERDVPIADEPMLVLVEAPTGEGKTEAAFYLTTRLFGATSMRNGLYVAMPSQATSNQLFMRLQDFLRRAHDPASGPANLRLVHGQALLVEAQEKLITHPHVWLSTYDHEVPSLTLSVPVTTLGWFLPKKRGLLAPYGVGTVDQTFLGVLFARHFFLRMYGLAGKVVIFDEVHAYDTYMSELFLLLLRWLRSVGAHVIVLSATLPEQTRKAIFEAWTSQTEGGDGGAPYPVCWVVTSSQTQLLPFKATFEQKVTLEWGDPQPEAVVQRALSAYREGACVGIIVNTVRRAQAVYRLLRDTEAARNCHLLHARFPFEEREQREKEILTCFGKNRPEKTGAILVATQVAEQSLDLDFDYLITDLVPIDLLLQRRGRLHRHPGKQRPDAYSRARLCILTAEAGENPFPPVAEQGGGTVYSTALLYLTWLTLTIRKSLHLPDDYRTLIEAVYARKVLDEVSLRPEQQAKLQEALQKEENEQQQARLQAWQRRIPEPDHLEKLVELTYPALAEEDEVQVHRDFRALTRLAEITLETICLFTLDDEIYLDRHGSRPLSAYDAGEAPSTLLKALLRRGLRLSHPGLIDTLLQMKHPAFWETLNEHLPVLRYYAPLVFDANGMCVVGNYQLILDEETGLEITRSAAA